MSNLWGIVVNLDRCIGCFACEVACKQEHNITKGNGFIQVTRLGPKSINGKKRMDFIPVISEKCTFCKQRITKDREPFCVYSCPVKALEFCETMGILQFLSSERRYHVCKIMEVRSLLSN